MFNLEEALISDLSAILFKYQEKDWFKPKQKKIIGIDRLLLILDDFEVLQFPLLEFLIGYFLQELKNANFESTLIIIGRDQLQITHPA